MGRRYQKVKTGPGDGGTAGLPPPAKEEPLSPAARRSPSAGAGVEASPNKGKGKTRADRVRSSPAADEFGAESQPASPGPGCEAKPALVDDDLACTKCQSKDDGASMVLCDTCDAPWHLYCLTPKLKEVPEGDWHCPTCAKGESTCPSLSAAPQASNRKTAKPYQLEPDSEDDDLFLPQKKAGAPASDGNVKKTPCKTPRGLTAASAQTPADKKCSQGKGVKSMGKSTKKASAKKASAQSAKAVAEKVRASKEAAVSEDEDFKQGKNNQSTKPQMQDDEPKGPPTKRRKTMPTAAKALLGMFEKDLELEKQMERALELEKKAQRSHDAGAADPVSEEERRLLSGLDDGEDLTQEKTKPAAPLTQEKAKPGKRSSAAWLKDLTRRKSHRAKQDDADSSDSDIEVDAHMQECYFPNKVYLQGMLKDSNFDVKAFLNDKQAKATRQDGIDEMMMREQVGRRPLEKEKKELAKVVKCMLKEFPQYVQADDDTVDPPIPQKC